MEQMMKRMIASVWFCVPVLVMGASACVEGTLPGEMGRVAQLSSDPPPYDDIFMDPGAFVGTRWEAWIGKLPRSLGAGNGHTCVRYADKVVCWGANLSQQLGQPNPQLANFDPTTVAFLP